MPYSKAKLARQKQTKTVSSVSKESVTDIDKTGESFSVRKLLASVSTVEHLLSFPMLLFSYKITQALSYISLEEKQIHPLKIFPSPDLYYSSCKQSHIARIFLCFFMNPAVSIDLGTKATLPI